jgi:hypothetical protein
MTKGHKKLITEFQGTQAESLVKMVVAARDGVKVKRTRTKKKDQPKPQIPAQGYQGGFDAYA